MTPAGSPFILAIEPDTRQADVLKTLVEQEVRAEITIVDSRDAAVAALATRVPDVILLTALLSPRDEEELIAHLRTFEGADHVQTHTLPMLASAPQDESASGGGLFGRFKRKKESAPVAGCDPSVYAEEVRGYLARAAEMRIEAQNAAAWAAPRPEEGNWASNEGIEAELARARAAREEHTSEPAVEEAGGGPADPWTYRPAYQHAEARQEPAAETIIQPDPPPLDEAQLADFVHDVRQPEGAEAVARAEQQREEERLRREAEEQRALQAERLRRELEEEEARIIREAEEQAALEAERERILREAEEEKARLAREAEEQQAALEAERDRMRREAEEEKARLARDAEERERAERKA